jgi:hypothetical protein
VQQQEQMRQQRVQQQELEQQQRVQRQEQLLLSYRKQPGQQQR